MTVLSNQDIKRELGINIYIYPFKESNLKGASYNLTASKFAWSLADKKRLDTTNNKIVIPARDTALIETEEVIWISEKISGTYHSRVSKVSQGIGHINTTLDPDYIGSSLIALHNNTNNDIELTVGEAFVTLTLQYVHTPASKKDRKNSPGRKDILSEIKIPIDDEDVKNWFSQDYMVDEKQLFKKLCECEDYKEIEQERNKEKISRFFSDNFRTLCLILSLSLLISLVLDIFQGKWNSVGETFNSLLAKFTPSIISAIIALKINEIKQ